MQISTYVIGSDSWISLVMNDGDESEMSEKKLQIRGKKGQIIYVMLN